MTLSINILGFEVATLHLELPVYEPGVVSPVDKAAKGLSRWFIDRLAK